MLQKLKEPLVLRLERIYKASIRLSWIPRGWKRANVVFLPKSGKRTHDTARDFRSISLTSFMLKVLEGLMGIHIRSVIADNLSTAQYA